MLNFGPLWIRVWHPWCRVCIAYRGIFPDPTARIATNSLYDAQSQQLLEKLGWQTIRELIDMEAATIVYRSINYEAPNYLTSFFKRLSQITIREPRNTKADLKLPLLKTMLNSTFGIYMVNLNSQFEFPDILFSAHAFLTLGCHWSYHGFHGFLGLFISWFICFP